MIAWLASRPPVLVILALVGVSVLGLARRERARGAMWTVAAMLALVAAFLVKETAVWCAPIWIHVIARDLRLAGWRVVVRRFGPALGVGVVLGIAYLAIC